KFPFGNRLNPEIVRPIDPLKEGALVPAPNDTSKADTAKVTPVVVMKFPMPGLAPAAEPKLKGSKLKPSSRIAKLLKVAVGIPENWPEVTIAVEKVARVCVSAPLGLWLKLTLLAAM